jgi:hypothetical protein
MTDQDVGNMFLNFQLHRTTVPYTGVDLSLLYESDSDAGPRWAVWDRTLMGFATSPYNSIKMALVSEKICRGDRHEQGLGSDGKEWNPFQWDRIRSNLPGWKDYDPAKSWISKIRVDGRVVCDLFTFVDDEQVTGSDKDLTWQASHALASKQSYLGIQDMGQKAQLSSKMPGVLAGAIVHVLSVLGVCVLTLKEKWVKMKDILEKWWKLISGPMTPRLLHKELLSDHGFLVYVMRTYPAMILYLM